MKLNDQNAMEKHVHFYEIKRTKCYGKTCLFLIKLKARNDMKKQAYSHEIKRPKCYEKTSLFFK